MHFLFIPPTYTVKTGTVVLLHPEVSRDDSCLAFQLSAFHPTSFVSAEQGRLKTCCPMRALHIYKERRDRNPTVKVTCCFVRFASPARGFNSDFLTCLWENCMAYGSEGRDHHLVCRLIPLEVWLHNRQGN